MCVCVCVCAKLCIMPLHILKTNYNLPIMIESSLFTTMTLHILEPKCNL